MIEEKPVNPVDDGSSPYLRRPRRSYERAQRDREDRDREIVAEDTKLVQSGRFPPVRRGALDLNRWHMASGAAVIELRSHLVRAY